ncbi:prolyl endopeptidase FAP-like isoform X2 [Daktulosphaira vitifoliae]|uniref:prolyl endopeptidase FAP-like isoform X2 n=1 Tax=Daktulosphaira vitifoliae TaxID=58002 RepID=UPI0021AA86B4|nr:prolyl endopeptidase FAP-like isoform X2 [Daktulosphaira vitifoliae]XP_050544682.1 prolyl endopeptidase FAP-like isoform X2 [Daktulosphaira vitifoliae]
MSSDSHKFQSLRQARKSVSIAAEKEELVVITPNERNWRGILIALLVIVAVLGLIVFFIVLLSPPYQGPRNLGSKFTIDQIIGDTFKAPPFNGTWISNVELVIRDTQGGVSVYNVETNRHRILLTSSSFKRVNAVDFYVSSDQNFILLASEVKKVHTNTREAKYHVFEVATQNGVSLTIVPKSVDDNDAIFVQKVQWLPTGNGLVFVYKNDLYYKIQASRSSRIIRITYSGSSVIYNGIPDWLYQEEIFKSDKAFWFSPTGRFMAYASFNDTLVGEYKYPVYNERSQYPYYQSLRYSKAGTQNPIVTVWLTDLKNGSVINVTSLNKPQALNLESELYLMHVKWADDRRLAVVWMNRKRTTMVISVCSEPNWECQDSYVEKITDGLGWLEGTQVLFNKEGTSYLAILPVSDGQHGTFPHVCTINVFTQVMVPLTTGSISVIKIVQWDLQNQLIYFEAVPEGKAAQRHLYKISDNINSTANWECLTCPPVNVTKNETKSNISTSSDISDSFRLSLKGLESSKLPQDSWPVRTNSCLYVRTHFSQYPNSKYYVLECLGPQVPKVMLMNLQTNQKVMTLNNYTQLAVKYSTMAKPNIQIMQVEIENGFIAQTKLMLPPAFKEYDETAFPFILYVKGKPGSQSVTEEWSVDWATYLSSNRNIIIAIIDGRGTLGQGDRHRQSIHYKLGSIDIQDQINVLLYLRDTLKFIDRERIGIWGKGYGGYATGMILANKPSVFKCALSIAPITNWSHFDSAWTEKIMGTPNVTDNYRGYEDSNLNKKAKYLKDKLLLLIHGSADEVVHYQHSMMIIKALTENGILFRHQTYPDEGHDFDGVTRHLLLSMEHFWDECFGPLDFDDWDESLSFFTFTQ